MSTSIPPPPPPAHTLRLSFALSNTWCDIGALADCSQCSELRSSGMGPASHTLWCPTDNGAFHQGTQEGGVAPARLTHEGPLVFAVCRLSFDLAAQPPQKNIGLDIGLGNRKSKTQNDHSSHAVWWLQCRRTQQMCQSLRLAMPGLCTSSNNRHRRGFLQTCGKGGLDGLKSGAKSQGNAYRRVLRCLVEGWKVVNTRGAQTCHDYPRRPFRIRQKRNCQKGLPQ